MQKIAVAKRNGFEDGNCGGQRHVSLFLENDLQKFE
jgi:hypothetical protein